MRVPFFYGWIVVAVAFVTMAIGVNTRTAFSLLFPPILDEFGWGRGVTAGTISVGFLISMLFTPFLGRLMDRWGPRRVIPLGVGLICAGLVLGTLAREPWHLYLTLGVLVVGGSVCVGYTGHALFLPHWFIRRRGAAMGLAFAGVGLGAPNPVLQARPPEDRHLVADGDLAPASITAGRSHPDNVVDQAWASVDWTLARAMGPARFWWVFLGFFSGLFAWYAVQVHQTKYLIEIGFTPAVAADGPGFVGLGGGVGQIGLGPLS